MQTKWKKALLAVLLVGLITPQVQAASQDECAIWFCLPAGFAVPSCGGAYKAMVKRIKDFKPPLPSFSSCAVKSGNNSSMSYDYEDAAYVPAGQRCAEWADFGDKTGSECLRIEKWDSHYVKGTRCRTQKEDENYPPGCVGTAKYVDVYVDGEQAGETFYWDKKGPSRW